MSRTSTVAAVAVRRWPRRDQVIYAEWMRQSRQVVLDLDAMLTGKQRAHALERLRDQAETFTTWSRKPEPR